MICFCLAASAQPNTELGWPSCNPVSNMVLPATLAPRSRTGSRNERDDSALVWLLTISVTPLLWVHAQQIDPQQMLGLLVSSVLKAVGVTCGAGVTWELWLLWLHDCYWNPHFSSLFLAIFIHLSFASLWVGWNWSRSFMWCPKRLQKLVAHPVLPFLVSPSWRVLSWCWAMLAWGMGSCRQMKLSSFPFRVVILKCFVQ